MNVEAHNSEHIMLGGRTKYIRVWFKQQFLHNQIGISSVIDHLNAEKEKRGGTFIILCHCKIH